MEGIIIWIFVGDLLRIIVVAVSADVVEYHLIFWMNRDISPLIKAAKHQEHIIDCRDGCFPYTLGGIRQDTKEQRADTLRRVFKLGS